MINTNSPLESLAAFAIVFAVGVISTTALSGYIGWIKKKQMTKPANKTHQ